MSKGYSVMGAVAIAVAVGAAMTVALDDAGVGIALGAAAFVAFFKPARETAELALFARQWFR